MKTTCAARRSAFFRSSASALGLALACLTAPSARAETLPPNLPLGPDGAAPPTPAPLFSNEIPPYQSTDGPFAPFNGPMPPALALPSPIAIPGAMPPPEIETPASPLAIPSTTPKRPVRPAPFNLPERPDGRAPPAGGLRQAMAELDRRAGIGSSGALVSSARGAAESETVTGEATFAVLIDGAGVVRSARLMNASRDEEGWRRIANTLRASPVTDMRAPEIARGVWVELLVTAENERVSGRRGRWWSPGVMMVFDAAEKGAPVRRVVHARALSEVWF